MSVCLPWAVLTLFISSRLCGRSWAVVGLPRPFPPSHLWCKALISMLSWLTLLRSIAGPGDP